MENSTLKEKMIEFFHNSLDMSKSFQKKTYQNQIQAAYDEYQDMFQMLQEKMKVPMKQSRKYLRTSRNMRLNR